MTDTSVTIVTFARGCWPWGGTVTGSVTSPSQQEGAYSDSPGVAF